MCLLAMGCGLTDRSTLEQSASARFSTADESLDFLDALDTQPITTNDDALHGLLILVDYQPAPDSWKGRAEAAVTLGWLTERHIPANPNESARVGMIAVCICHVLDVRGGLSMRLAGRTPRYCTRELVHMGLIPGITENEALSGSEFLALLAATEQKLREQEARGGTNANTSPPEQGDGKGDLE